MHGQKYQQERQKLLDLCLETVKSKNRDYANLNTDFLAFFKQGEVIGTTPYQECGTLLKKQINAVYSFIKGGHESEPIKMRIVDAINYLIFLHTLIVEEQEKNAVDPFEIDPSKVILGPSPLVGAPWPPFGGMTTLGGPPDTNIIYTNIGTEER